MKLQKTSNCKQEFQHDESKKYVTILSLWSLSGTLRLLYHHLEWVICSSWCALITFGGGGFMKLGPVNNAALFGPC